MNKTQSYQIAASTAEGFELRAGSTIRVINTMGAQVVGTWAFVPSDMSEFMSMEHTRIHSKSSRPQIGTIFFTNNHQPILELTTDRSPGVHDWYLAACNQQRYEILGHQGKHANCTDNFHAVLNKFDRNTSFVQCPLNLFENVSFMYGSPMEIKPPVTMPGDYVSLKALIDCFVVLSACPQDISPTNGEDLVPRGVEVEIISSES